MISLLLLTAVTAHGPRIDAPILISGRVKPVISKLATMAKLQANARCAGSIGNIPICLRLASGADAEHILATLLAAEWQDKGGIRTLARTGEARRQMQNEQAKLLEVACSRVVANWKKFVRRVGSDPREFGYLIQRQLDEYVRTSGASGGTLDLPVDLIRKACAIDVGAAGIARLGLDEHLYFSNVSDGVHRPFGPECTRAISVFQRAVEEPSVREALRVARQASAGNMEDVDFTHTRVVVWITRLPQGIASYVWVYSAKGNLLASGMGLDEVRVSGIDQPVEIPNKDFKPSELSRLLGLRYAGRLENDPKDSVYDLLRSISATSILDPLVQDLCAAIGAAFPGRSIAIQLDEGWFREWAGPFSSEHSSVKTVLDACDSARGLRYIDSGTTLYFKPALLADSESMVADPEALQRDMLAQFSMTEKAFRTSANFHTPYRDPRFNLELLAPTAA